MTESCTEYAEIPGLDGVSVVRHAGMPPTGARHAHRSVCVGAVVAGVRHTDIAGVRHTTAAGQVMVIPPDAPHACSDSGTSEYIMISIPLSCFEEAGLDPADLAAAELISDDPARFGAVLRLANMARQPASRLERQAALLEVMEPLCTGSASMVALVPEQDRIAAVRRHLEECHADDVPLKVLAGMAGCSPCRLNRVFASVVGMPPHEYQIMQRVRRVKECIRNGKSLADSAVEAGFSDQSHMTRCFRKVMGMTPGVFAGGLAE
ncbi:MULTISPECIES: AraC family transcriptional regulator [unclassified Pseudodesulfovibrio]|uniref:helix-turn-helix domain-containing protein n=1 Tax=unclassified Pseudodesulfovibrio TaxID=2661612 RepID=UPI000FEBD7B5|nr:MULTISPECIES: AraC family transcriptional regulator [unclassified Pseudodesulfovibrio]MCJ2165458.1 AraC family transcriptional regulator [Pseudodesulfovibrio sp. S3-i]RWU03207.1 AraC family transcriptional regulator [Pseudodesulfovibrio sp. S3]